MIVFPNNIKSPRLQRANRSPPMAVARELGTSGGPNGTRLDCLPGGRELGEYAYGGTWMDCPLGGREFGEYGASNGMGLDCPPKLRKQRPGARYNVFFHAN